MREIQEDEPHIRLANARAWRDTEPRRRRVLKQQISGLYREVCTLCDSINLFRMHNKRVDKFSADFSLVNFEYTGILVVTL
jgi:hypothetical protein